MISKKKKVINLFPTFLFVSKKREGKGEGSLGGHTEHFRGAKSPKKYEFDAKLPKTYEIAQNFDAKLPKKYEIARNFDARSTP